MTNTDDMVVLKIQKFPDLEKPAIIIGPNRIRLNKAAAEMIGDDHDIDLVISREVKGLSISPADASVGANIGQQKRKRKPNGTVIIAPAKLTPPK